MPYTIHDTFPHPGKRFILNYMLNDNLSYCTHLFEQSEFDALSTANHRLRHLSTYMKIKWGRLDGLEGRVYEWNPRKGSFEPKKD